MKDEKILNDEFLNDEELEQVAGGAMCEFESYNAKANQNYLIQEKKPPTYQPRVIIGWRKNIFTK